MIKNADFRYDINALRAIAVLGVILFHYKVPFFDGGFSGVDIFFVISGFLMTRIVINGISLNNFSLLQFYGKRVQRILPALLFLVLILSFVNYFIFIPNDYQLIAKNAFASLLFYSNNLYYHSNYFDSSSDTNMFLHTWSLSVEWQFYMLLPIALTLLGKYLKSDSKIYLILFIVFTLAIFSVSLIIARIRPNAAFYLLPTRSWEMLIGGIAFLVSGRVKTYGLRNLAILGYIILGISFVALNNKMMWPGPFTLIPIIGTFMVIVSNLNDLKILRLPVIQYLGRISYSLYLWHWPLYVISNYLGIQLSLVTTLILALVSFIFAIISYRFVESAKLNGSKGVLISTATLSVIVLFLSHYRVNNFLFKEKTLEIANYSQDHRKEQVSQFNSGSCFVTSEGSGLKTYNKEKCLNIQEGKKNLILLGDSHSAHFAKSLHEALNKKNINMSQASASGCLPLINKNGAERCNEIIDYIYFDYLPKNANRIDGVIISANWTLSNANTPILIKQINETLLYLKKLNIKAVIIGQSETYTIPFSSIAAKEYEYGESLSIKFLNAKSMEVNKELIAGIAPFYINIYQLNKIPKLSATLVPYMFDQNHFTLYGADLVTEHILSTNTFSSFIK